MTFLWFIQGPFRDPCEVQAQRYRALSPTLRMATDMDALQKARADYRASEWVNCISDEMYVYKLLDISNILNL